MQAADDSLDSIATIGGASMYVAAKATELDPACSQCAVSISGSTFSGSSLQRSMTASSVPVGADIHLNALSASASISQTEFGITTTPSSSPRYASIATSGSTTGSMSLTSVTFDGTQQGGGVLIAGSHTGQVSLNGVEADQLSTGSMCPAVTDASSGSNQPTGPGTGIHALTITNSHFRGPAYSGPYSSASSSSIAPGDWTKMDGISPSSSNVCKYSRACALDLRPGSSGVKTELSSSKVEGFRCIARSAVHMLSSSGVFTVKNSEFRDIASAAASDSAGSASR